MRYALPMALFNPFADQVRAFADDDLLAAHRRAEAGGDREQAEVLGAEIRRRRLRDDALPSSQRVARRVIIIGFACLAVCVLGMLALGVALLRT